MPAIAWERRLRQSQNVTAAAGATTGNDVAGLSHGQQTWGLSKWEWQWLATDGSCHWHSYFWWWNINYPTRISKFTFSSILTILQLHLILPPHISHRYQVCYHLNAAVRKWVKLMKMHRFQQKIMNSHFAWNCINTAAWAAYSSMLEEGQSINRLTVVEWSVVLCWLCLGSTVK